MPVSPTPSVPPPDGVLADPAVPGAAQGPIPEPVPATGTAASATPADPPATALGRRTLSTAFVRVGPDGYLTIELRGGDTLVLRDVTLNAKDYCGTGAHGRYCGAYADVAAARPGGAPAAAAPPGSDDARGVRRDGS